MLRLSKFLVTLPLLALPIASLAPKAGAEPVTQMDALRLLAKSRAADGKCKTLAPADADELNSYLARAELAAASRNSVSEVQSTMTLGKTLGDTATCSPATSEEINATLNAARAAMTAAKEDRPAEEETVAVINPPPRRKSQPAPSVTSERVTLAAYGRHAYAYYVERRCEYLSRRDIRSFWTIILREHRAALGTYGGPAVAGTLRRARNQAEGVSCDAAGRRLVQSEYMRLARN